MSPVVFVGGAISPTCRGDAAQKIGQRRTVALQRHRHPDCFGDRRHDVDILSELFDRGAVCMRIIRVTNDADDVITGVEETEFFF